MGEKQPQVYITVTNRSVVPLLLQTLHDSRVRLHELELKGLLISVQAVRPLTNATCIDQNATEKDENDERGIELSVISCCHHQSSSVVRSVLRLFELPSCPLGPLQRHRNLVPEALTGPVSCSPLVGVSKCDTSTTYK